MPHTNVTSNWVDGDLYFKDKSGNTIAIFDGTNSVLDIKTLKLNGSSVNVTATEINALDASAANVARTATADGLTTGTIADAGLIQFVSVTSTNADHIIVLPTPTPGTIVILNVGANGFELRSSSPTTIAINGGTGAAAESAIAANSTIIAICISATEWKAIFLDADSDVAKVEAAA